MSRSPDGDRRPVRVPFSLAAALAISSSLTVAFGVSNLATRFGDLAHSPSPRRTHVGAIAVAVSRTQSTRSRRW